MSRILIQLTEQFVGHLIQLSFAQFVRYYCTLCSHIVVKFTAVVYVRLWLYGTYTICGRWLYSIVARTIHVPTFKCGFRGLIKEKSLRITTLFNYNNVVPNRDNCCGLIQVVNLWCSFLIRLTTRYKLYLNIIYSFQLT